MARDEIADRQTISIVPLREKPKFLDDKISLKAKSERTVFHVYMSLTFTGCFSPDRYVSKNKLQGFPEEVFSNNDQLQYL